MHNAVLHMKSMAMLLSLSFPPPSLFFSRIIVFISKNICAIEAAIYPTNNK